MKVLIASLESNCMAFGLCMLCLRKTDPDTDSSARCTTAKDSSCKGIQSTRGPTENSFPNPFASNLQIVLTFVLGWKIFMAGML